MRPIPIIPNNAPFSAEQRLWLNGFLAGLFASVSADQSSSALADSPPARAAVKLLIIFGSQTGTAEGLSKKISKQADAGGCKTTVLDAANHASIDWKGESHLLIITSTYGDGEMPDNAQGFWDWLKTDAGSALSHLKYSVLALGDTNYSEFCAAGKMFDARLSEVGATRVHERADCDVDYEGTAMAWAGATLAAIQKDSGFPQLALTAPVVDAAPASEEQGYSKARPFPARLVTNRNLVGEGSAKETRHFEISLEGSGLNYEAGDALGVFPGNCTALVNDLLAAIGSDGDEAISVSGGPEIQFRKALAESLDITKPGTDLLKWSAEHSDELRTLLAPDRKEDLKQWLWGREVIDVIHAANGAKITAAALVPLLKKLTPRLYSISSSPKAHAGHVHLTIAVVRHDSHGRPRKGVCSTFLADRAAEAPVPVFIQTSHGFRLPADGSIPVIMVGPGTGVAPFRGFLHERRATGATGRNWLFFGEQREATDFYYQEELRAMQADGHLTRLSTAFSRDQAEKIYVQNRLIEHAAEVWAWLQDGAHFYVCGDASRMAKDVDSALHTIVQTQSGLDAEGAVTFVQKLKTDKRYQRDVY